MIIVQIFGHFLSIALMAMSAAFLLLPEKLGDPPKEAAIFFMLMAIWVLLSIIVTKL